MNIRRVAQTGNKPKGGVDLVIRIGKKDKSFQIRVPGHTAGATCRAEAGGQNFDKQLVELIANFPVVGFGPISTEEAEAQLDMRGRMELGSGIANITQRPQDTATQTDNPYINVEEEEPAGDLDLGMV